MKLIRGLYVSDGETWNMAKKQMIDFIVHQLGKAHGTESRMAHRVQEGLFKLNVNELRALNLMVYTSREGRQ